MIEFRYFNDVEKNAALTKNACDPGHSGPFLDGNFFNNDFEDQGVCLDCLVKGRKRVKVDGYLKSKISKHVGNQADRAKIIAGLERTPPVPWIQNNDWPFCDADAMQYRGEHSVEKRFADKEFDFTPAKLWSILDENSRAQAGDPQSLLDAVADGLAACFIFRCLHCGRFEAVCQSY
jgi:uncharacterized protein CbrC (UPF0167 family)